MYERTDAYNDVVKELIDTHEELKDVCSIVAIDILHSDIKKKKNGKATLGECIKVPEKWQVYCPYNFVIVIYEENCVGMTDEQMKTLLYHELLHVGVEGKAGEDARLYIRPHDAVDFRAIVEDKGLDWAKV